MKYLPEFKDQILKEVKESRNITAVAKKHKMPDSTIHTWLAKERRVQPKEEAQSELKKAKKEISDLKLKNMVLEDLLKKTHNLWAND